MFESSDPTVPNMVHYDKDWPVETTFAAGMVWNNFLIIMGGHSGSSVKARKVFHYCPFSILRLYINIYLCM